MSHAGLVEAHCATCGKWTGWTSPNRPATAEPIQCHGCIAKRQAERIFADLDAPLVPITETKEDREGFDRNGFDHAGYDRTGFNADGFDRNGCRIRILSGRPVGSR